MASRIEFDDETGAITGTSRDSSTMRVVFTIVQPPETAFVSFLGQTFQFAAIHSEDLATKIRAVGGWKDMGWVGCQSARKRTNADSVQILSTD